MMQKTYYTNGKDEFKDFEFDNNEWSAPYMVSYQEIKERMDSFNLIGRTIKDIRVIGLSYMHTRDWVEEAAYNRLEKMGFSEEEIRKRSDYDSIDDDLPFYRYMEIDEPIMFWFEDNDHFEIVTEVEPEYRMSMNKIPWWIAPGINTANADASVIFSPCIGASIERIEYNTSTVTEEVDSPIEIVNELIIWLSNGFGLLITTVSHDYCDVYLVDKEKELVEMAFKELKKALFNWEDLHVDEVTGFFSECSSFYFGSKGREHVGTPIVSICDESREHQLRMNSDDDFHLFAWAISVVLGTQYDQYDDYELSWKQWNAVLDEADKIANFSSFDELYDYFLKLKADGGCDLMYYVDHCAVDYWKHKELHKREASDMRKWCDLALGTSDKIFLIGF